MLSRIGMCMYIIWSVVHRPGNFWVGFTRPNIRSTQQRAGKFVPLCDTLDRVDATILEGKIYILSKDLYTRYAGGSSSHILFCHTKLSLYQTPSVMKKTDGGQWASFDTRHEGNARKGNCFIPTLHQPLFYQQQILYFEC